MSGTIRVGLPRKSRSLRDGGVHVLQGRLGENPSFATQILLEGESLQARDLLGSSVGKWSRYFGRIGGRFIGDSKTLILQYHCLPRFLTEAK